MIRELLLVVVMVALISSSAACEPSPEKPTKPTPTPSLTPSGQLGIGDSAEAECFRVTLDGLQIEPGQYGGEMLVITLTVENIVQSRCYLMVPDDAYVIDSGGKVYRPDRDFAELVPGEIMNLQLQFTGEDMPQRDATDLDLVVWGGTMEKVEFKLPQLNTL